MPRTHRSGSTPLWPLDPAALRAALQVAEPPYPGPRMLLRELSGEPVARLAGPPPGRQPRHAAVLVLFYPRRNQVTVLLIRRQEYAGHHSGQIGLPGGSIEPDDADALAAALREAREEVGLERRRLELWGRLQPHYIPVSNFLVEPFLAWSATRPRLRPDPIEVAEVVEAPLATLLDPHTLEEEVWTVGGQRLVVPFFRVGPHKVWGATAHILDQVRWRLEQAGVLSPES
ncbi:MAG: CoA pyrophosphatase [Chloroflexi bacterium]|nr:CoA pyrophosphatase [Chloroflexota bacterium]